MLGLLVHLVQQGNSKVHYQEALKLPGVLAVYTAEDPFTIDGGYFQNSTFTR